MFKEKDCQIRKEKVMLDAKDLEAIGSLMKEYGKEQDERWNARMKEYGKEQDEKWNARMKEYGEEQDEKWNARMKEYGKEQDERWNAQLERRVTKSESLLLDEMDRMKKHLDEKIDRIGRDVAEMKQYYRIDRLENQTITAMMKNMEEMRKDINELKEVVGI